MGKKGTDGRRTSGITPMQVFNALCDKETGHGYVLLTAANQDAPKTAFRKVVTDTQNKWRQYIPAEQRKAKHEVVTSTTGDSVFLARSHNAHKEDSIMLPVAGHMTDNALAAIQRRTGVDLSQLKQLHNRNH